MASLRRAVVDMTDVDRATLTERLHAEEQRLRQSGEIAFAFVANRERVRGDEADASSDEELHTTELRLRDRDKQLLEKVRLAIRRLERGEIDECMDCGGHIGIRRLLARPVTTLCIDCKEAQEQSEKAHGIEDDSSSGFDFGP